MLNKLQAAKATSQDATLYHSMASDVPLEIVPEMAEAHDRKAAAETTAELYEWLCLVRLGSPRAMHEDTIDPYLSRYKPPAEAKGPLNVCCVRWIGMINAEWVWSLLTDLLARCPGESWFALSATEIAANGTRGGNETTVTRLPAPADQYIVWEIERGG